jgi:hydrogenase maturation protease
MDLARIEQITGALLYEGYILYPYRRSSVKNRQRWTLGGLYPRAFGGEPGAVDAWSMQTECLICGHERTVFEVRVRFLHLIERTDSAAPGPWQEATERDVAAPSLRLGELLGPPREIAFVFPSYREISGTVMRQQEAIEGGITMSADRIGEGLFRVTIGVRNLTPFETTGPDRARRDAATLRSLASAHTLVSVSNGELISLLEPPDALREAAAACRNVGTWPVLVGEPGARDTMLSSPIILYDYPRVAPESSGDLFDTT